MSESRVLTNALLTQLQPLMLTDRGYTMDVNTLTMSGLYRVDSVTNGIYDKRYGMVIHLSADNAIALLQIHICMEPSRRTILFRTKWSSGSWLDWTEV